MRNIIKVTALCFSLMAASAFGEVEQKNLKLHFQNSNHFIPMAVAVEKGWFKESGFEKVELKSFSSGALAGEALLADEISVWFPGNLPVISMRHNAVPVVIAGKICSVYEKFVVRDDAGVKTPKDLYNIRIGLLKGSTASAVLDNIVKEYDLDNTKLNVVNLSPPEQVTALASNEVQGIIVWEPVATKALDSSASHLVLNDNKSQFTDDYGHEVPASRTLVPMVFTEPFMRENPETAKAVVETLAKAVEYISDPENIDEAVEIFSKYSERETADILKEWSEYKFDLNIDNNYVADMENYSNFLVENGRISAASSPLSYTYTDYLKSYNPKYVSVEGQWK